MWWVHSYWVDAAGQTSCKLEPVLQEHSTLGIADPAEGVAGDEAAAEEDIQDSKQELVQPLRVYGGECNVCRV